MRELAFDPPQERQPAPRSPRARPSELAPHAPPDTRSPTAERAGLAPTRPPGPLLWRTDAAAF